MEIILILFIVLFLSSLGCAIFLFKKNCHYRRIIDNEAKASKDRIRGLNEEKKVLIERVRELEDGIKETFSVSVRNDVTKVECVFDKTEMAFIMAGIWKLIQSPDSGIEDKEWYIKLYKKIQSHIDDMEEPKDES